jgi:Protein of unknown function (DUF2442)
MMNFFALGGAFMAELTQADIDKAEEAGRRYFETHPTAKGVRYDWATDRVIVDLNSGCTFAFPPRLVQGLGEATPEQLSQVYTGSGIGLHWDELDVDITVAGLMNGIFGTSKWMASRAGRSTTPAKAAAARENGKKGGRPRKDKHELQHIWSRVPFLHLGGVARPCARRGCRWLPAGLAALRSGHPAVSRQAPPRPV